MCFIINLRYEDMSSLSPNIFPHPTHPSSSPSLILRIEPKTSDMLGMFSTFELYQSLSCSDWLQHTLESRQVLNL